MALEWRQHKRGRETPNATVVKLKICLVGDSAVGKTSLVHRYVRDQFNDDYLKSFGAKVAKKTLMIPWNGSEVQVDMILWDVAGAGGLESVLKRDYLAGTQGVLIVCDATDSKTLYGMTDWIEAVRKLTGDVPVQIVINKSDACDEEAAGLSLSPDGSISCIRVSARTGNNVERAFYELASRIVLERMEKTMASPRSASAVRPQA
jgi:small GTP-binding protein